MKTMIARWFERIRIGRANSYLKVCLFICMLLSVASVKASSFTVNGVSYETISDTTCKVVAGDEAYEGMVNIPSEVSYNSVAYKVSSIGDQAFLNCGGLMDVSLPESLEEIGSEAFGYCYALTAISIPDNVKRIDKSAFIGTNLQNLYIGDCINRIGMRAFSFVPSVHLTSSISKINDVAFEDADDLRYIYIPNSVKEMEANAFAFCGNLQCVYIDDLANWCEIKFGNQYANPTSKAGGIYLNGNSVTYLDVPEGVKSINDYAFYGCKTIYELKLSDTVEKIGKCAFKECGSIPTFHIGRGLRYIGPDAIWGNGINTIYTDDINAFCQIDVEDFIFNQLYQTELICDGKVVTKVTIDETVNHIGKNVFRYYAKLASVSMPNSVTSLGESAFDCCTGLIKITLSDSIKVLSRGVLDCTINLSKITLPSNLIEIGPHALASSGVQKVELPPTTEKIGAYAFMDCKADSIILSDIITELGEYAFEDCKNLRYVYLGKALKRIDGSCFMFCKMLESINLPSTMEYVDMGWTDFLNFQCVYCNSSEPYDANFSQSILEQATLYVPQGCRERFLADYRWNGFKEIVEMDGLGAVDEIACEISPNIPIDVYDCSGKWISNSLENLNAGIYIVKQGKQTKKVVMK